jgi:hypothetical protein
VRAGAAGESVVHGPLVTRCKRRDLGRFVPSAGAQQDHRQQREQPFRH